MTALFVPFPSLDADLSLPFLHHSATVHFPIGFLTLSFALDTLQLLPAVTHGLTYLKVFPPAAVVNTLSHYTGAAGLLSAVPSILTGLSELYGMWKGQVEEKGLKGSVADAAVKKDIKGEKLKTTLTHATLNDIVLGIAAYNWFVFSLLSLFFHFPRLLSASLSLSHFVLPSPPPDIPPLPFLPLTSSSLLSGGPAVNLPTSSSRPRTPSSPPPPSPSSSTPLTSAPPSSTNTVSESRGRERRRRLRRRLTRSEFSLACPSFLS
jgi:uncharacterized membrane protein